MKLRLKTRDSGWFPAKRTIGKGDMRGDWGCKWPHTGGPFYPESGNRPHPFKICI